MEKKIIFCNIAWMKNYSGTNNDPPMNGGQHIKDVGSGGEVYSFLDDNGKCHGFVRIHGNIALEKHFKEAKAKDEYIDDVLVVWVATNKKKETRIVGWYKNARVYRSDKDLIFFANHKESSYYNVVADAKDCYLIPEDLRTFPIHRASEVGCGMGFGQSNIWYAESEFAKKNIVPKVIEYIEDYKGSYANFVYDLWDLEKEIEDIEFSNDFTKLYEEGVRNYNQKNFYDSIVYFKAAQRIDESTEMLAKLAESLFYALRYDKAISLFNKLIDIEGETINSLKFIMSSYDYIEDREKTIKYANKIISFPTDSYDDIEDKTLAYCVLFDIYIYKNKFKKAEKIMNDFEDYSKRIAKYYQEDISEITYKMKEVLGESQQDLIR